MKITNETKTGMMVLVCFSLLIALLLKVGNYGLFQKNYILKSHMEFIGGVKKHSPVRLSGVAVGEVKDIRILYGDQMMIEVDMYVHEGVKIRKNAVACITTMGLMGEMYVEIKPGSSAAPYAVPGDIIKGEGPARLEELVKLGSQVATDIGAMARDISKVANNIDGTIGENRPTLKRIFTNLEETSMNFKEFSEDIKYNPWKILARGKEKTKEEIAREKAGASFTKKKNNFA